MENAVLCKVTLNDQDLEQIRSSIEELFYFEFVSGMIAILFFFYGFEYLKKKKDDIPMRGFIGRFEEGSLMTIPHTHHTYLYTHYHFTFEYNQNRVI